MSPALHVVRAGVGPRLLLIHGSAADHSTWSIQLASSSLREAFSLIAYDRRSDVTTVEEHAEDAAGLLAESSAPAVIALELLRRYPERCAGAVLIEPPMGPTDAPPTASVEFLAAFDRCAAQEGGPAAGELFLKTVLGEAAFQRMPRMFRERSISKWREIRADSGALIAYRPRYAELANLRVPVKLLGGGRSASYFRPTLDALLAALPLAQLEIIDGAGHMLHAEAHRRFAEILTSFAREVFGMAESTA